MSIILRGRGTERERAIESVASKGYAPPPGYVVEALSANERLKVLITDNPSSGGSLSGRGTERERAIESLRSLCHSRMPCTVVEALSANERLKENVLFANNIIMHNVVEALSANERLKVDHLPLVRVFSISW